MNQVSVVMYHYVRPIKNSKYPNIKGLEVELFRKQLEYFQDNYCVVTMEQVIDSIEKHTILPPNAMLLTFDDGYKDHYQYVFPLLKEFHMQGSFFVPSSVVERNVMLDVNKIHYILACADIDYLVDRVYTLLDEYRKKGYNIENTDAIYKKIAVANRWDTEETIFVKRLLQTYLEETLRNNMVDQLFCEIVKENQVEFSKKLYLNMDEIIEMKDGGMYFGLHGEYHHWLNHLPKDKMRKDIANSLIFFKDVIDKNYLAMNYPYGGYNEDVLEYCRLIGCKLGVTVESKIADLEIDNPMLIPRFDTNDFPPMNILKQNSN